MLAPVRFENVEKIYRSPWGGPAVAALRDVSFAVEPGEVFGLLGPNRAGKTTALKILLSVCKPTRGTITRFGAPLRDRKPMARIGYLHEKQAFPTYLTARELLGFFGAMSGLSSARVAALTPGLLERVGIADRGNEPIRQFSKGMHQRLALAQALLNEPDLLILDEPTEGLDLNGRRLIHDVVRQQKTMGKTTLLVTHNVVDVERLCDRVAVLRTGQLLFLGPTSDLTHDPAGGPPRPLANALEELYERGEDAP